MEKKTFIIGRLLVKSFILSLFLSLLTLFIIAYWGSDFQFTKCGDADNLYTGSWGHNQKVCWIYYRNPIHKSNVKVWEYSDYDWCFSDFLKGGKFRSFTNQSYFALVSIWLKWQWIFILGLVYTPVVWFFMKFKIKIG